MGCSVISLYQYESATPIELTSKNIEYAETLIRGCAFDKINPNIIPTEFQNWMYGAGIVNAYQFIKKLVTF